MKKIKNIVILISVLLIIILTATIYFIYYIPDNFFVKNIDIVNNKIDPVFNNFKIVFVSDLNFSNKMDIKKTDKVISIINNQNPDLIIFGGDLITIDTILDDKKTSYLTNKLKSLKAEYGKFFVFGDKENQNKKDIDIIKKIFFNGDFEDINNKNIEIHKKNSKLINLTGIDLLNKESKETINKKYDDNFKIFIGHDPSYINSINASNSYFLAGHTLGGIVRLPFFNNLIKAGNNNYIYGEYNLSNNSKAYITSGLFLDTNKIRIGTRNEIIVINLYNKKP